MNRMSNGISIAACGRSTVPKKSQESKRNLCITVYNAIETGSPLCLVGL
jgi:hypothetical protein